MSSTRSFFDCRTADEALEFMNIAEYRARCFVNAMRRNERTGKLEPVGWEFSDRFLPHPWVREAISDGWGKELRSHLILTVKNRICHGKPYDNIDELMPPREWVAYAKQQAERYRKAAEWRNANVRTGDMSGWLAKLMESNRRSSEEEAA